MKQQQKLSDIPAMSESQKNPKTDEIVVFKIVRDSACAECGEELWKGRMLRLENERPLCLGCKARKRLLRRERRERLSTLLWCCSMIQLCGFTVRQWSAWLRSCMNEDGYIQLTNSAGGVSGST